MRRAGFAALPLMVVLVAGCQTAYYGAMEKIGHPKRDILVDRVKDARDDQEAAKKQFASALEEFTSVTGFKGGQLQEAYDTLSAAYERSKSKADDVHTSIAKVDNVAQALFKEWEGELEQYTNEGLRRESARKLTQTRDRYAQLIEAMKRVESRIAPVLDTFHDQVLFIKHNLNAQAIASLQGQLGGIENDVGALIKEMEISIAEANRFIGEMGKEEK
jgi:hypothetical protein